MILYNVFGKIVGVQRKNEEWILFNVSKDTGKRSRMYDVVIPSELTEDELTEYLHDIFHEQANEKCPSVYRIK